MPTHLGLALPSSSAWRDGLINCTAGLVGVEGIQSVSSDARPSEGPVKALVKVAQHCISQRQRVSQYRYE